MAKTAARLAAARPGGAEDMNRHNLWCAARITAEKVMMKWLSKLLAKFPNSQQESGNRAGVYL
jgi:hypothetical protein